MTKQNNTPLTVRRQICLNEICEAIERAKVPAFVAVDVLERVMQEMRRRAVIEYQRDVAAVENQAMEDKACE